MQDLNDQEDVPENDVTMEDDIPPQSQTYDTIPSYPPSYSHSPQRANSRETFHSPPPTIHTEDTSQDAELARRMQIQEMSPPRSYDNLSGMDDYFPRRRTDPSQVNCQLFSFLIRKAFSFAI
jgi:hypothetical protein